MSAISELLTTSPEAFVNKLLPKGDYLCQIIEAELMHGYWKANPPKRPKARWFEAYVPTIEIIDVVPTGDEDIDAEQMAALEAFGDWKGYKPPKDKGRWVQPQDIPGYDDKVTCAGMAFINFVLAETTEEWEAMTKLADSAHRFYTSKNSQGNPDGWVIKTLSTDPETHTPPAIDSDTGLAEVIEATKGCYLVVSIGHEQDEEQKYEPKLTVEATSAV